MTSKIIPIEQAVEMRNEYHTHVKTSIESARGNGYQATEFAWIDLKTLKYEPMVYKKCLALPNATTLRENKPT